MQWEGSGPTRTLMTLALTPEQSEFLPPTHKGEQYCNQIQSHTTDTAAKHIKNTGDSSPDSLGGMLLSCAPGFPCLRSSHLRIHGISCVSIGSSGLDQDTQAPLSTSESGQATPLPPFITVTFPKDCSKVIFVMRHGKDHIAPGGPGFTRGMPSVI